MARGREAVQGLAALKRQFKALPDVAREALADAAEETAIQVAAAARRRVPVRYGFLRDDIASTVSRTTGVAKVGLVKRVHMIPGGGPAKPSRYGHLVEFGTVQSEAQPFMLPSLEEQHGPYLQRAKAAGTTIERDMAAIGQRFL